MENPNYRILINYEELEKEYGIKFKNLEVVESWIYDIYRLVINEVDGKKFKYNDYSKLLQDSEKIIWDLGVITYLYEFNSQEKFDEYKELIQKISWLEWKFDGIQRPRTIWEFEYKWKYFLIVTYKEATVETEVFEQMLSNPWLYLNKISTPQDILNSVNNILENE